MGSQLKWAGHVERMEGERLMKRVDALRVHGRRRGRPRLRWEANRDLAGVGGKNESKGWRSGVGGDSSEMGSVMEKGKTKIDNRH